MKTYAALIAGLLGLALAHPLESAAAPREFTCGAVPNAAFDKAVAEVVAREKASATGLLSDDVSPAAIVVDTYFHNVYDAQTAAGGYITDANFQRQLQVMNQNYSPSGISFRLVQITRTQNAGWAVNNNESAMRSALRKGTYKTLNIYFQKSIQGNLGYCYFPESNPSAATIRLDGCSVLAASAPGGSATNFNLGKTATHEVGHWFGLYHTFQGGCNGAGDQVSDTPAQASPTSGCPTGRDSCPNQTGLDPINNYMDYSYDSCYTNFTPGQTTRMTNLFNSLRANR